MRPSLDATQAAAASTTPDSPPTKPRMQELLARIDGGRVLHVGCVGHGKYKDPEADWLHHHLDTVADELIGVDIDEDGIDDLQALGWDARVDDATILATIEAPVDVVVAGEVIEHLSNPGDLFAAAGDVLAPGGRLLISTPNPWAACYLKRVALGGDPVGNEEHTCWLDESTLAELAGRYGFEGSIDYLEPMALGVSSVCYALGHERLGGTRLLGEFRYGD